MRKNVVSFQSITDGDLAGDITSMATNILYQDEVSFVVGWSGSSLNGSLAIEVQNGSSPWTVYGTPTTINTTSGSVALGINNIPFERVRLKYTRTAGTGTLNAFIVTKQ